MNDEQLAKLFGSQKIPPASAAAKAAALKAAMEAFTTQNISSAQTDSTQYSEPVEVDIQYSTNPTSSVKNVFLTFVTSLAHGFSRKSNATYKKVGSRETPTNTSEPRYLLSGRASRFSGLIAVAGLHFTVIIALVIGLSPKSEMVMIDNVKVESVEDRKEKVEPPPPPPPDYVPPPPDFAPPPTFNVAADAPAPANAITTTALKAESAAPVLAAPKIAAKTLEKGLTSPAYPIESKKLGEEGVVELSLYLNADGKVQSARVEVSSGFSRLDDAAVKHAVKAWKFEPCIEDKKPIACWHKIKFRFQLKGA
jgi:periplasmic protein TonB